MPEIIMVPVGHQSPDRFEAVLDGEVLCRSRQPFFDAARVLVGRGMDPATVITARHQDSPITAMRGAIGELAKWAIEERDRGGLRKVPWQPSPWATKGQAPIPGKAAEIGSAEK